MAPHPPRPSQHLVRGKGCFPGIPFPSLEGFTESEAKLRFPCSVSPDEEEAGGVAVPSEAPGQVSVSGYIVVQFHSFLRKLCGERVLAGAQETSSTGGSGLQTGN